MSLTGTEVPQYPDAPTAGAPVLWCVAAARRPSRARSSSWGSLNRRADRIGRAWADSENRAQRPGKSVPWRSVALPTPDAAVCPGSWASPRAPTPSPEPAELRAPSLEQDLARPRSLRHRARGWLVLGLGSPAGLSGSALPAPRRRRPSPSLLSPRVVAARMAALAALVPKKIAGRGDGQ